MRKALTVGVLTAALALSAVATAFAVSAQMGNEAIARGNVDSYSNFTIVDTNNPAAFDGVFDSITYDAARDNDIRFVIVDSDDVVTWVSEVISPDGTGLNTAAFDSPVGVTAGDNLGVYSVGQGAVSYEVDSVNAEPAEFEPNNAGLPEVDDTLAYQSSSPRFYSMNATITATSPDICKKGGWEDLGYKNQGQCIASIVANEQAGRS